MAGWAKGYDKRLPDGRTISGRPVVTCHEAAGGAASIPFVGLAEALVLTAFRRSGVPLQRIRPALAELERHIGLRTWFVSHPDALPDSPELRQAGSP